MTAADRAGARPVTTAATIRRLRPSDYGTVIAVIDEWWGGRPMSDMLPRLFFEHFADTSFAADRAGTLTGFLVGFLSQSQPGEAYIHFVGVRPGQRGQGLGRRLYEALLRGGQRARLHGGPGGDRAGEHRLGRVPPPDGVLGRAAAGSA